MAQAPQMPVSIDSSVALDNANAALPEVKAAPAITNFDSRVAINPPHSSTASTLASTSEFVRYFLLALPARYISRSILDSIFSKEASKGYKKFADSLTDHFSPRTRNLDASTHSRMHATTKVHGVLLDSSFGLGSLALTTSYSRLVYDDMLNLFSEAVAYEKGKAPQDVTFNDLRKSDNKIVAKTVENFYWKTGSRLATDVLFFARPLVNMVKWGELVLGIKGAQVFLETWKREPTLFEHIATLVNNRINPRNGLGQAISVGDVFDLYQHYHIQYRSGKAFANVIENEPTESQIWSKGKVVFDRVTDLLNDTYAYKHASSIDEKTGLPIRKADFALPKLIYLLGHNLIEPEKPEKTLFYIETANRYGMVAVRDVKKRLDQGETLDSLAKSYPVVVRASETKISPQPVEAVKQVEAIVPNNQISAHAQHHGAIITPQTQALLPM